jgi:hypothetical protein
MLWYVLGFLQSVFNSLHVHEVTILFSVSLAEVRTLEVEQSFAFSGLELELEELFVLPSQLLLYDLSSVCIPAILLRKTQSCHSLCL